MAQQQKISVISSHSLTESYGSVGDSKRVRADSVMSLNEHEDHGINVPLTVVFLAGISAGIGMLALPYAVSLVDWGGFIIIFFSYIFASVAAIRLGKSWTMVQELDPEYSRDVRNPYTLIGYHAYGNVGKYAVSAVINIYNFGCSAVAIILLSEIMEDMLPESVGVGKCLWMVIFGSVLTPCTWLGTPKEFWGMALFSLGSTVIANVLIVSQLIMQYDGSPPRQAEIEPNNIFLSLGIILLAFGGAPCYPAVQNDMKRRDKFPLAAKCSFTLLLILYSTISVTGFATLRADAADNILLSLDAGPIQIIVDILISIHLFSTFTIVLNPVAQEAEEKLQVPPVFCWQRVVLRSSLVIAAVFVGESIPSFGKVLSLLGGMLMPPASFIFPVLFYMKLCSTHSPPKEVPLWEKILLWSIIVIGVLGGCAATYSSVRDIVNPESMSKPCYL